MKQIKYNNKQANNATTPSGIFTADNANEIKNVVNANALEVITNYALKQDIIKAQAEYHAFTGTVITVPVKQNSWTFLLGGHTYTQASGGNITVPLKTIAVANYISGTWIKAGEIEIPQQITLFSFKSDIVYKAGDTIAYLNKIFRVKASIVSTQQEPSLISTDWEILGGYNIIEIDGKLTVINADITTLKNNKVDKVAGKSLLDDNQITKLLNDYTKAEIDTKILSINNNLTIVNADITTLKNNKVDKVTGKGLSTNDYTDAEKAKVAVINNNDSGDNIFEIQTPDGARVLTLDNKGLLFAQYQDESIQKTAVSGLITDLETLKETANTVEKNNNLLEIKDKAGNIFAFLDEHGVFDIQKLRVSDFDHYGEQFEDISFIQDTTVVIPELKFFKVNVEGQLPWDTWNLTSVDNTITLYTADNKPLVKYNTKQSIQGASSAGGHIKKGFTFDLFNDEWQAVEMKIGSLISVDSYHTKGFWGDCTHTRDTGNGRLYLEIAKSRPYPYNLVRDVQTTIPTAFNKATSAVEDAKFSSDGIPFAMYHHGKFYGLYTWRLKKTRLNYALDNNNENHIFLDSWTAGVALGNQTYANYDAIAEKYEVRSPKTKSITANTKANIERFFSYMREIHNGTKDFNTSHQDYITLIAWIDWKIQVEVIGHWDSVSNNAAYITYDGLKWYPVMADTDNTLGLNAYSLPVTNATGQFINKDIWIKFNIAFLPQIKARYKELRDKGIISNGSAKKIFGDIAENVPYYIYEQDYVKWNSWSGRPIIMDSLYTFFSNRIKYLDSIWLS